MQTTPKLEQTPSLGSSVQRLVRLLGFGRSTGYVKPDEIPQPPPRKPREKPEQPEWAEKWDALVDAYSEGKTFEYLGIKMMVVASRKSFLNISMMMWGDYHLYWMVSPIRAEYVDGNGRIREKTFDERTALICLPNSQDQP